MNYSYKKFLETADAAYKAALKEAERTAEHIGVAFSADESFLWKDGFEDAVGRCGPPVRDGDHFCLSIHFRAIYHAIGPQDYPPEEECLIEREIGISVRETVLHEAAHGFFDYFLDMTAHDDDLWDWCVAKGFDKTLFVPECDCAAYGEEIAEEYASETEKSRLGQFITEYTREFNTGNQTKWHERKSI